MSWKSLMILLCLLLNIVYVEQMETEVVCLCLQRNVSR